MNIRPEWHASSRYIFEAEQIRALVMNLHSILRITNAADRAEKPIERIHRALDRLVNDLMRRTSAPYTTTSDADAPGRD